MTCKPATQGWPNTCPQGTPGTSQCQNRTLPAVTYRHPPLSATARHCSLTPSNDPQGTTCTRMAQRHFRYHHSYRTDAACTARPGTSRTSAAHSPPPMSTSNRAPALQDNIGSPPALPATQDRPHARNTGCSCTSARSGSSCTRQSTDTPLRWSCHSGTANTAPSRWTHC